MSGKRKSTQVKNVLFCLFGLQYYKIPVAMSLVFLIVAATLAAIDKHYWANQIALYSFYLLVTGLFLLIYLSVKQKSW